MENVKRAHMQRAREMYDNPEMDTPGESFEQYFENGYVDQYGAENKKKDPNRAVIERYLGRLENTREKDGQDTPGLLGRVQVEGKGPYPANPEEDEDLLHQIMKFIHSEEMQKNVVELMKTSPNNLAESIASTAANISAKLIFEIRKQREVKEETEGVMVTIAVEDLWTMAKNMGMQNITPEIVKNSTRIASAAYNKLEEQMKTADQPQAEQVPGLTQGQPPGPPQEQSQGPPQGQPQEQPPQGGM